MGWPRSVAMVLAPIAAFLWMFVNVPVLVFFGGITAVVSFAVVGVLYLMFGLSNLNWVLGLGLGPAAVVVYVIAVMDLFEDFTKPVPRLPNLIDD